MKMAAIVNLHSGSGRAGKLWPQVAHRFDHMDVKFTRSAGHATDLTRDLLAAGVDRILAVGGDGTIHEIVNGWLVDDRPIREQATLAVLPFGTGSDYRKSLGIREFEDAFQLAHEEGTFSPIDLGRISYLSHGGHTESRLFMNVVSFGMGGEVALASKNFFSRLGGKAAFQYATLKVFLTYRARTAALELDGADKGDHQITNIAIGIGRYHGGGMHVCPRSSLDDGLFEVTVIRKLAPWELARDLPVLYSEDLYVHPKVDHHRAERVVAQSSEKVSIEVDGEALGTLPVELSIIPRVLRVARR